MLSLADLSPIAISTDADSAVLAFAAEEVRWHLAAHAQGEIRPRLSARSLASDGFRVRVADDALTIDGESPRGTLNGVYWLLEQLGWLWVEPGPDGVTFTPGRTLAEGDYRESPAVPRRTLVLGQDALHDDWFAWLEWASRNRYNDLFFHDTPPSAWDRGGQRRPETAEELAADRKGWMFERWDADGSRIVEEAGKRGMTLQFGGHHLPTLLPRTEFEAHPAWFPVRQGARDPKYNVCTASPGLRKYLAERVEAFVARFPGADVYHFWGDDIRGGGWCECAQCPPTASDQALLATNLVAEAVASVQPGARVAHLAYHDTLCLPAAVRPAENVALLFAPRERCYAHAIDDGGCTRNREQYWGPFTALVNLFEGGPDRIHVFEYYSDAILFKGLAPTHLEVLPHDTRAYREAGGSNIQDLLVADRPWVGPPWHAWWAARCLWEPTPRAASELARFCTAAYGSAGDALRGYYEDAEGAYRALLDLHDFDDAPGRDVLDFAPTPPATLARKGVELAEAAKTFARLHGLLRSLTSARAGREAVQADFLAQLARHLAARTVAWSHELSGRPDLALARAGDARRALDAINDWDADHNKAAYAVISRRMRRAMDYYTAQLERTNRDG